MKALRSVGARVQSLAQLGAGCPDILVSFRKKLYLFEIKDGRKTPSRRRLTPAQREWHDHWPGVARVITSPQEALDAVLKATH